MVFPSPNNTLITTVYRKPTHTDQCLHWDSNHFITAHKGVFNTLAHRAKIVCTNQQALHKEMEHIRKALEACNFPPWALNTLHDKFNCKHNIHNEQTSTDNQPNNNNSGSNNIHRLGKRFKDMQQLGNQVHFKGTKTIKNPSHGPRTGTANFKRVESYIHSNAHTSTVRRNAQGNLAEPLGTGSKNTSGPHPLYTTTATLQDTQ